MDLGGCQNKAPLILSGPHFLDTDPDLSKLVNGLNPDPAVHATFVDIEPVILYFLLFPRISFYLFYSIYFILSGLELTNPDVIQLSNPEDLQRQERSFTY